MNEIKIYKEVHFLGLCNGEMALLYPDRLEVGNIVVFTEKGDDFVIWDKSQYLSRKRNYKRMIFDGNVFVDWPQGRYGETNIIKDCSYSSKVDNGIYSLSIFQNDKEYLLNIEYVECGLDLVNIEDNVLILSDNYIDCRTLLFYIKTGQRLWEYHEEDENLKINGRCMPIVDGVVVVISMKGLNPKKIQGFDIRSGKRMWNVTIENGVSNTLFVGSDKMLYGCKSVWIKPLFSSKLILTKLNPLTGELYTTTISEGECFDVMPWLVTMHGNKLYYTDHRPGTEIGVIDVDKKEIVDREPLKYKNKANIGAPIVTDDKIYVFSNVMQELRVYEK